MTNQRPVIGSVHETVLYAADVRRAAAFYADVLGLRSVGGLEEQGAVFRLGAGDSVLLIFDPRHAATEGRGVPTHGAVGSGHIAFAVGKGELSQWRQRLEAAGVAIELEREWPRGGRSVYVRDPAGNSVELVEGAIWPE